MTMVTICGRVPWRFASPKNVHRYRFSQLLCASGVLEAKSSQAIGHLFKSELTSETRFCNSNGKNIAKNTSSSCMNLELRHHSNILCKILNIHTKTWQFANTCSRSHLHSSSRELTGGVAAATQTHTSTSWHDDKSEHEGTGSNLVEIEKLVTYLQEENAINTCVIRVPPEMDYVEYFVVCSGYGTRHLRRMADGLVAEMKPVRIGSNNRRIRIEGQDCSDWMAVDMGTIVVHFMTEEARSKYELEKLWTLGPRYDDQYRNMEHIIENNP